MQKKLIVIEVPKDFDPYFCALCFPHKCNGRLGCPVPNAKELVELHSWGEITTADKVFAVKEEA